MNYSAIETGSKLGGFGHDPRLFFILVAVIIGLGFIAFAVWTIMGGN